MTNDDVTRVYLTPCATDTIYWSGPVELAGYATLASLRLAYAAGPGHYFDRDALRFFGSRNMHLVTGAGGCVTVETQTNTPAGMPRYKVEVWFMDDGLPRPAGGCRHSTLAQARACARRYYVAFSDPAGQLDPASPRNA